MRRLIFAVLPVVVVGCAAPTTYLKRANNSPAAFFTPGSLVYEDVRCTFSFSSDPSRVRSLVSSAPPEVRAKYESFGTMPLAAARDACRSASTEIAMVCSEDCFGQEFTYYGLSKGVIRFVYREFSNGMVRMPYDLSLEYDADTKVIAFREKRFAVEGLTSEGIKLRPVSQ